MTNENNKSDYTKPAMDLSKLLPEPLRSDVNQSLFGNLFNRFLTKQETDRVTGYIGIGNDNAITSRQIKEINVHRQAYQLQPILYDKIGSIEHMASWKDLQNELERLGIDIEKFAAWGATEQFNWVPPVDIDKIINYTNYYWVDENKEAPQYITVRNRCSTATSLVAFWETVILQYGSTFPIVEMLESDDASSLPTFPISSIDSGTNKVFVTGDITTDLQLGNFFDIVNTTSNNGTYEIINNPVYSGVNNTTELEVIGLTANEVIGEVKQRKFDKIVIGANSTIVDGNYATLFEEGFVFFIRNVNNQELNNSFLTAVKSESNIDDLTTTITIENPVTNNDVTAGLLSLEEQLLVYNAEQLCQCNTTASGANASAGWDDEILWDDNPSNPLWGDDEDATGNPIPDGISDHANLLNLITQSTAPVAPGSEGELWYNQISNILYQYSTSTGWKVIWNNFNLIINLTTGFSLWDLDDTECDTRTRITSIDQWINQNNWQHKNTVTNFTSVKRASQPIIEYEWDLELNEWTYSDYRWSYRGEQDDDFVETTITPPWIELEPITWWELENAIDVNNKTIILDGRYGDLTDSFVIGNRYYIDDGSSLTLHAVVKTEYKRISEQHLYRTYVTLDVKPTSTGDLNDLQVNSFSISPFETINGDTWKGYGIHWLFLGISDAVPVSHKIDNPYATIPEGAANTPFTGGGASTIYNFQTNLFVETYILAPSTGSPIGYSEFLLSGDLTYAGSPPTPLDTVPLNRKALYGYDDIRVYLSNVLGGDIVRQFGNYEEIPEAVFTVIAIDGDEFVIDIENSVPTFSSGNIIRLSGNTGIKDQNFTVISNSPSVVNRIKVTPAPTGATFTGEITNLSNPVTDSSFINSKNVTLYVHGISFFQNILPGQNVIIEVGPANLHEIGNTEFDVRMDESDITYAINGNFPVSLIEDRLVEQVKTKVNQYPLFDIFNSDGTSAHLANSIFGYRTSTTSILNANTGLRIVSDPVNGLYEFDQFLLEEDNGDLLAYRDYSNKQTDFWYNPETNALLFWGGTEWSDKTEMSNHYRKAILSSFEPDDTEKAIDGLYWYDTILNKLFRRFINPTTLIGSWIEETPIDRFVTDINLQTIWRGGLNNEQYVPDKVDWKRRSLIEYDAEKKVFIDARVIALMSSSSITEQDAITQTTAEWFTSQVNDLSLDGSWVGDWEIPDPLYFNHLHENRKYLDTTELLTHFNSIIAAQSKVPGFSGTPSGMFSLIPSTDVNYGNGGTIKEYNNGFDTLLSSIFVNNVTPRSLIEFAHDQYEALLNSLKDLYRENAIEFLTNLESENILDLSAFIADKVIEKHELNDQTGFVYGDSTTFTDNSGVNDGGVRNWIATLPYINLGNKILPTRIIDGDNSIDEVVHHDGHRNNYALTAATKDIISQIVVNSTDPRTSDPIGRTSSTLPPNTIAEFATEYGNTILSMDGVYWYYTPSGSSKTLYRYVVASSSPNQPGDSVPDGTLWMDLATNFEVLRIKNTNYLGAITWDVVSGLSIGDGKLHNGTDVTDATISAWEIIDLSELLNDSIFELETRLYTNAPTFDMAAYDFDAIRNNNPVVYERFLEEAFLDYVSQSNIATPYINEEYLITNPFTWNYKRSAGNGGLTIISADGLTNSFTVAGDKQSFFVMDFYIKNSGNNDGTWTPISTALDVNNNTQVFVTGDVVDGLIGLLYIGILPSPKTTAQPNNLNDGSESGGDWRDLYTKLYNTPYPHLEPWKLQGYDIMPDWWDTEYKNTEILKWGDRRWKYKHGFEIVASDNNNTDSIDGTHGIFAIEGDFHDVFISEAVFDIDNSVTHAGSYTVGERDPLISVTTGVAGTASITIADFPPDPAANIYSIGMRIGIDATTANPSINDFVRTYTIKEVNHVINDFIITVEEEILAGDIIIGTHFINGALYDPVTNLTEIKIPGLVTGSPTVADGRIIKAHGMWDNIRTGRIPAGSAYPNGITSITGIPTSDIILGLLVSELPTFNYFSVNISNVPVSADGGTTTYNADAVFPPFWDYTGAYTLSPNFFDINTRSVFYNFSTEIISSNAVYVFGDAGDVEWVWRTSSQFLYDQLTIAYRIDPMNFIFSSFGFNLTEIGNLKIDRDTKNTPSHTRTNFHGDIVDNGQYKNNGINQWYVNFNRYTGYDISFSDFRELWTGWTAPLSYQFASFVDTPSFNLAHRFVNVINFDYNITSKRAPGIDDFWLDAFKIGITNVPANIARYNNQHEWRFELKTNVSISRNIKYYDIHNYQFYADPATDTCTLFTWELLDLDTFDKSFSILGDQTHILTSGSNFTISGSTGNNGTYNISTSSYDIVSNRTTMFVNNVIVSAVKDGLITANHRTIPWSTGDVVYLSTAESLPIPLIGDTVNGLTAFYIVVLNDTSFKLAETKTEAIGNIVIDITSRGRSDHFVGQITNTFLANDGIVDNTNWRYYAIDKTNVLSINTPHTIQGIQTVVDIVHGYSEYVNDIGWKINDDKTLLDPDTNKIISWQLELDRFITYALANRNLRAIVNNRYPVTVDISNDEWTFIDENKSFITGDEVIVTSSNGIYPTPISMNLRYYVIRIALSTFKLAASITDAKNSIAIDITSIVGIGNLHVTKPSKSVVTIPDFELNPFRNGLWFNPERGIVSDIVRGPSEDIRSSQLIFDQAGDRIETDKLRVYRQDKQTKLQLVNTTDSGDAINLISPEYTLIHIGGIHLFIDAYEHVLLFNNYTSEDNLLYDPFIGLNVTKYEILFNRQPDFSHRPNIGGYYLETFFNQGANINRNIEASVEDLRNAYDTYRNIETNLMTSHTRKALGYEGVTEYLSNLNLSQKSQFIFWRGQIQSKGSVNTIEAFTNSRRFIDAKLDEYWAVKVAEFGTTAEKEYPEMFVTTVDARSNELRLEFIDNDVDPSTVEETFVAVKMTDEDRWYNQPDQVKILRDNGKVLYFDSKIKNKFVADISDVVLNNTVYYIQHNLDIDDVNISHTDASTNTITPLIEGIDYTIINNNIITISLAVRSLLLASGSPADILSIYGRVVNTDAQSPARIIDHGSDTQISHIQFWDPARGIHYSSAIHNVDLQNDIDPAQYNITSQTTTYSGIWKDDFVGTSWLNTENLDYVPYYSDNMIPDRTERFRNWGQTADWSEIEIFEWVESDILPAEWDAAASTEEGDRTIPEHLRKAGTARKILLKNVAGEWVPAVNTFEEFYVATDSSYTGSEYEFTLNLSLFELEVGGSPPPYIINVYINGKLFEENANIFANPYAISDVDVKEADIVRFVQLLPTTQEEIDVLLGASPEQYRQEYEYTQVPFYNELGIIFNKYYFWVGNKRTKPTGKNRTMSIAEAEIQLSSIPAAHMFFQNIKQVESVSTDDLIFTRVETPSAVGSPLISGSPLSVTYDLDFPIAENTTILVEVNGVDLLESDYTFITVGVGSPSVGSVTIDASKVDPLGSPIDNVMITYTAVEADTIDLPHRYSQAIIRGLQGIVNADKRYTVQFVRDFTLRDGRDDVNEQINPTDGLAPTRSLKNLHEEWKIFRQEQQFNIDRWQWDKITESIVGYKLDDISTRVPSFERELYDETNNTDTRYGIGEAQTFVNGVLALNTIETYLTDPEIDFTPIDINSFFVNNSFDTADNIIASMNEIYNSFLFTHVNRIYFSVLHDAFTTKARHPSIFKTSMVSLHGIRPFQTSGIFDD